MTKSEERRWRKFYTEQARKWKCNPWALAVSLEAIMEFQDLTAAQKLKLMKLAMEVYNDALNETIANTTGSGQHRTSCPEHTED